MSDPIMTADWGPWIKHDGMGCPDNLRGRLVRLECRLSQPDETGWKKGDVGVNDVILCPVLAEMPDWLGFMAGKIVRCPLSGRRYGVCTILRYRVWTITVQTPVTEAADAPVPADG